MTAPTRIAYGPRNTYRLDPYVRDVAGRFAPAPEVTPPPVQLIVDSAVTVESLHGGALVRCDDPAGANRWTVRVIRQHDGSHRVDCTPDHS